MGYDYFCSGEFESAAASVEKALEVMPDRDSWTSMYWRILLATKRYDDLLKQLEALRESEPLLGVHVLYQARVLVMADRPDEAEQVRDTYLALLAEEAPDDVAEWKQAINAGIAYARGDLQHFERCYEESENTYGAFAVALWRGDTSAAEKALQDMEADAYVYDLMLYCQSMKANDGDTAARLLETAIGKLSEGTQEERQAADMLRGDADLVQRRLGPIHIEPSTKCLLACALGLALPETQELCFAMARRHNFDRDTPYHTIASIVNRP